MISKKIPWVKNGRHFSDYVQNKLTRNFNTDNRSSYLNDYFNGILGKSIDGKLYENLILKSNDPPDPNKAGHYNLFKIYDYKQEKKYKYVDKDRIEHTFLFECYCNHIFYSSILNLLIKQRESYIEKINDIMSPQFSNEEKLSQYFSSIMGLFDERYDYKKWLTKRSLSEFIPILESRMVRGQMTVLESLRTLNDRPKIKAIVIKGREEKIDLLDAAIKELNDIKKTEDDEKEQRKKAREERRAEAETKKKQEQELQNKQNKDRILRLREKEKQLDAEKKIEEKDTKSEPIAESVKTREELEKEQMTKLKQEKKLTKQKEKKKSLYEMFFGPTEESVLKEKTYIPPSKKIRKIAELELNEYKDSRDTLLKQLKR